MKGANLALAFALVFTLISVASCDDVDSEQPDPYLTPGAREILIDLFFNLLKDTEDNAHSRAELIGPTINKLYNGKLHHVAEYLLSCKDHYLEESTFNIERDGFKSSTETTHILWALDGGESTLRESCDPDKMAVPEEMPALRESCDPDDIRKQLDDMVQSYSDLMNAAISIVRLLQHH